MCRSFSRPTDIQPIAAAEGEDGLARPVFGGETAASRVCVAWRMFSAWRM